MEGIRGKSDSQQVKITRNARREKMKKKMKEQFVFISLIAVVFQTLNVYMINYKFVQGV